MSSLQDRAKFLLRQVGPLRRKPRKLSRDAAKIIAKFRHLLEAERWINGNLWIPQEDLAKELGITQPTVSRILARLRRLGYLVRTFMGSKESGLCDRYMLLDPAAAMETDAAKVQRELIKARPSRHKRKMTSATRPGRIRHPVNYARAVVAGEMERIASAPPGQRNWPYCQAIYKIASRKAQHDLPIEETDVERESFEACRQSGYAATAGRSTVRAVFRSAWREGSHNRSDLSVDESTHPSEAEIRAFDERIEQIRRARPADWRATIEDMRHPLRDDTDAELAIMAERATQAHKDWRKAQGLDGCKSAYERVLPIREGRYAHEVDRLAPSDSERGAGASFSEWGAPRLRIQTNKMGPIRESWHGEINPHGKQDLTSIRMDGGGRALTVTGWDRLPRACAWWSPPNPATNRLASARSKTGPST